MLWETLHAFRMRALFAYGPYWSLAPALTAAVRALLLLCGIQNSTGTLNKNALNHVLLYVAVCCSQINLGAFEKYFLN